MTTTRWWAPITPGVIEHGELDMLLAGGGDPQADMGLVLMAGHKAGAAALQNVAKSAMASESALVNDLAATRADIAPRMVDAIAVTTGKPYADLLVRDVLDEADQGALDLFRAAVAKGVAPPVAMERAAAGYGLPTKEMGAFHALAADPKANPRAVEDAGDRSLMEYVAKVAAQEAVSPVSKAATPSRQATATQTDFDPAEHPRGPDGRFTDAPAEAPLSALDRVRQRLGLLSREPTKVAETAPATPTAVEQRRARAKRTATVQRKARLQATGRTVAQAKPERTRPARTKPQRTVQRTVTRKNLTRMADRLNAGRTAPEPKAAIPLPDLLHKLPDPGGEYYDIGQPIVIGTSQIAASSIRTKASDQAITQIDPSRKIFRIGHLVNEARYVEKAGDAAIETHALAAEREREAQSQEYMAPRVRFIEHRDMTGDPREDMLYAEKQRKLMATHDVEMPNGDMRPVTDYDELNNVEVLPVYEAVGEEEYDDMGRLMHGRPEALALVHFQPADPYKPLERPVPTVEEFVILSDARGTLEGAGEHVDVQLDPNTVYEVVQSPHRAPNARITAERSWDPEHLVVVNRWYLRPVDPDDVGDIIEGVDKALSPAQVELFNRLHPRDAEGQFAETATQAPAKVDAVQARRQRARRTAKIRARTVRPIAATQSVTRTPERTVTRNAPTRTVTRTVNRHPLAHALQRKVAARAEKTKAPVLSDTQVYKLMPEHFFQNLFPKGETSDEAFMAMHRGEPLALTSRQKMIVGGLREIPVDGLAVNMVLNVNKLMDDQRIHRELLVEIPLPEQHGAVPDFDVVAEEVDNLLKKRPDLDLVELSLDDEMRNVLVFGAKVSGSYQNVVEIDPELNWNGQLYLNYVGEHRAADMLAQGQDATYSLIEDLTDIDVAHEGAIPNPYVHYYRLTSAPVRRFRVDDR